MTLTRIPEGTYRMFGNPYQIPVYSMNELSDLIELNNGVNDCFLSISIFKDEQIIPLFFPIDLDGSKAETDAKKILKFLEDYDLNYYFISSGYKGYHFQVPLSGRHSKIDFMNFAQYLRKTLKLKSIDMRVSQDPRRLMRIPGTMNMKNNSICHIIEIFKDGVDLIVPYITNKFESENDIDFSFDVSNSNDLLHPYPCIEKLIKLHEPPHIIRLGYVVMMKNQGYSPEQIFNILETLDWNDWNPNYTWYQIRHILSKGYGINCSILKDYCLGEECKYHVKSRRKNK